MAKVINKTKTYKPITTFPLISSKQRLIILKKLFGIWKNRKPEPLQELKKIRKGWNRRLSSIR